MLAKIYINIWIYVFGIAEWNSMLWMNFLVKMHLLTSYQSCDQPEHVPVKVEKPSNDFTAELTLEQLFAQLDISDYAETFIKEGIDMDALLLCNDDDLKEGGLPLGM